MSACPVISAYKRPTYPVGLVGVQWTATCGTVTSSGRYTAPASPTVCTVTGTSEGRTAARVFTVAVPAPSLVGRMPVGLWLTPLATCGRPFTGIVINGWPPSTQASLDTARTQGCRLIINLLRNHQKDAAGHLSVAESQAHLDSFPWPQVVRAADDGVLLAWIVGDDITGGSGEWGGEKPPLIRWDSVGRIVKQHCPKCPVMIRATPTEMSGYPWRWVDGALAQYSAWRGSDEVYISRERRAAEAAGLSLAMGLNVLDGGSGTSGISGTYPVTDRQHYQMSADEILGYGVKQLGAPGVCGAAIGWRRGDNYTPAATWTPAQAKGIAGIDARPDVRAAWDSLGRVARTVTAPSCWRR